jgi:hypothetical protein
VLSLLGLLILSIWFPLAFVGFMIELSAYGLVLLSVGVQTSLMKKDFVLLFGVPLAITVMHLTWGSAFLWSIIVR